MEEKFIEVVKKYAAEGIEIKENSDILGDLGISSLGVFSMVCELEAIYGKKFNVMELVNVKTVGQLYQKFQGGSTIGGQPFDLYYR